MHSFVTWTVTALIALLLLAPRASGEDARLEEKVRALLPEGWVAQREAVNDLDRLMPDVHSFFCRLPARGGYPYERILVAGDGTVLVRTRDAAFLRTAEAEHIEVRRDADHWVQVEGAHAEVLRLLEVVRLRAEAPGRDPARALAIAIVFLDLLTYQGRFVSATVGAREGDGGFEVAIDWRQGSGLWSYEERATWTFGYDRGGALVTLSKARTAFEKHLRK